MWYYWCRINRKRNRAGKGTGWYSKKTQYWYNHIFAFKWAIKTSRIVADKNNITLQIEESLIEQNYGIYEGVDRKNDNFLANKRNFAYRYPNGESMMQVAYRIYGLIDKIKAQYQGKNVLIISHGGVCRIIRTYFIDMSNDEFFSYTLENGKLEEYEL